MANLTSILDVVIAIVAAGGKGSVVDFDDFLQIVFDACGVVVGLVDAYAPCLPLGLVPCATISPPISTMKFSIPMLRNRLAT